MCASAEVCWPRLCSVSGRWCGTGQLETCNGRWAAAMAERKPNGGGGAASASSSGTNLLFSSSATEFSFNVPFIPVTQAAAASASLLLPGGSKERGIWWGKCVGGGEQGAWGKEGRLGGFPSAWIRPSG